MKATKIQEIVLMISHLVFMFKKICSMILSLVTLSSVLSAVEYEINDIGTLQTRESQALAMNNQGQILGWYNIDKTPAGKHFFVRDKDGTFSALPSKENGVGVEINWRYLKDDGKAYGTFDGNANYSVLYVWDQKNGVVKLGNLPGKEISAINNVGQVLIKSIVENENGTTIRRPVIWENGHITKLNGLNGNVGIESDESHGLDMNNKGEVVGYSNVYLSYKNNLYSQTHATKWVNGQAIDLHYSLQKSEKTQALVTNDKGDILFSVNNSPIMKKIDGSFMKADSFGWPKKISNNGSFYNDYFFFTATKDIITYTDTLTKQVQDDASTPWTIVKKIISINDLGEIIAEGVTIYGEQHAMLLTPLNVK